MNNAAPANSMPALLYDIGAVRWALCKVAGWITPSAYWSRLSGLRLGRVAIPPLPGPEWVRLRTVLGGICGSDLSAIMQRPHPATIMQVFSSLPAVVGHENVAVVEGLGPAVRGWAPGERVVAEPSLSCVPRGISPVCPQCAAGRFTLCDNFRVGPLPVGSMIGWNNFTGGSWAPYFVAHQSQLYRVPTAISDEEAVLVDPLAGALHAVLKRPPGDDENVLILGTGLLGISIAAAIRALDYECRLTALGRPGRQAELMRRFGVNETISVGRADPQSVRYRRVARSIGGTVIPTKFGHQAFIGGFDLVYDCIGSGASLTDAMKYARSGGTVVEVGTSQIVLADTAPLWFNELQLLGANGRAIERWNGRSVHTYEIIFQLIKQKKLDLSGLVTHRFRIEQYRTAFAALANRGQSGAIKAVFVHT